MIELDGSTGEGGGQILRSSLALSMITGQPFRLTRIRAKRAKPGLMRQHLTAVRAAAELSNATLTGDELNSTELAFHPGKVTPGEYAFATGGAGSTTLVLQTVLPALLMTNAPSRVTLDGGTHNPFAPPVDFLDRAFLPHVRAMGPAVNLTLDRPGFYPAGGGRVTVDVTPAPLRPIEIVTRGDTLRRRARVLHSALPREIAERELTRILKKTGWPPEDATIDETSNPVGPGNVVMLEVACQHVTEIFTGFGAKGVSAEAVVDHAVDELRRWLPATEAPVGEHLADQLLLPMALAKAGAFIALPLTDHATTNMDVISRFLGTKFTVAPVSKRAVRVTVG